jgi:CHAT domain-containing protein/tetratricopeptide (TPR) repeat protein
VQYNCDVVRLYREGKTVQTLLLAQTPQTLAAELLAASDPVALLALTPYDPLDLLVELHQHVTRSILHDLPYAQQVAALVAAIAARHPADPLVQAQHHWTQAAAIAYLPDHAGALAHLDTALGLYEKAVIASAPAVPRRDIRIVQIVRVFCLTELGRYNEALDTVAIAEAWLAEHPNDYARLTLLLNRSLLAGSMSDYGHMIELSDGIIALASQLDQQARLAQAWINRGFACTVLGRFAEAEYALAQGCGLAEQASESLTLARGQWNRARLLRLQGKLFAALQSLAQARAGMAQASGEAATVAMEAAAIALRLHQLPEASQAANTAIRIYAEQKLPAYSAHAALQAVHVAVRYGHLRVARSAFTTARQQAAQAQRPLLDAELVLAEARLASAKPLASPALRRLRKRLAVAIEQLGQAGLTSEADEGRLLAAALAVHSGQQAEARTAYAALATHPAAYIRLEALASLAELLPPGEALPYLQAAAELAVAQRRTLPAEELQARYASETSPQLLRLAQAQLAVGQIEPALESVWAAKIGPLLDLRAGHGGADSQVQTLATSARATIALQRERYNEHARKAQQSVIDGQGERSRYHLAQARQALSEAESSEQRLNEALRQISDRIGQAALPSYAALQAALPATAVLLEYVAFDDTLGCFLVLPDQPARYQELGPLSALDPLLDRWALICGRGEADASAAQIASVLRGLYEYLLAPFANQLRDRQHLLLAPHGVLNRLPWLALIGEESRQQSPIPKLVLLPGGGLWATQPLPASEPVGPPRLLGYAGVGARRLAAVEQELSAIARYLPEAKQHNEATVALVQQPPAPSLLHIAAHSYANHAIPLCSTIELADGPFLLLEAHRLNLRGTQLVVLSACETGVVPDKGGTALALVGAFLCAGSAAVVASLWPVNDGATRQLMEHFYAAMASGASPAQALGAAAQSIRAAHPLDWAAFQLWAGARIAI